MRRSVPALSLGLLAFCLLLSCRNKSLPNGDMIHLLHTIEKKSHNRDNVFCPEAIREHCDSVLRTATSESELRKARYYKTVALLQLGEEQNAIDLLQALLQHTPIVEWEQRRTIMKELALAWLRLGERTNCINNHSAESCIYPVSYAGVHIDKTGSEKAIELYKTLLADDPGDVESRWLLNIAYMTTGGYPQEVPPSFLLKVRDDDSLQTVKPFSDVAANTGLHIRNMGGGSIIEDFNNDNYPDIIVSSWGLNEHISYCRNNGNGTFTDLSDSSWLGGLTGGLNIQQTDYNNDGFKDIFVLRGAWKGKFGNEPNSLLRNNGDGTFTDVTKESGLLSFHPTQTATWADFNNDGWLDVFIGNETSPNGGVHPCELYINNRNGTFTEQAALAGCAITEYVKGVTSGDYDNDGRPDIFISSLTAKKILLRNESEANGTVKFSNRSVEAGFGNSIGRSFATWFWDYNNDGWPDLLACSYEFYEPLASYAAAEALGAPIGNSSKVFLYRNNGDGTFNDVSDEAGLNKVAFAMGANFGDIDNDGFPDFYLGTGNPDFKSLVPNKLFKNINGQRFLDVTTSARVGNLQKGHGISFADMDNDGDEDIYIEMGGAYTGDAYENSLYLNPGQNNNRWINISLEGVASNKAAIGARIKVTFKEHNKERSVYRTVNSGSSFGANPLRQHIGIGQADTIESIEIKWPASSTVQVFKNVPAGINIKIREGDNDFSTYILKRIDFTSVRSGLIQCRPSH